MEHGLSMAKMSYQRTGITYIYIYIYIYICKIILGLESQGTSSSFTASENCHHR